MAGLHFDITADNTHFINSLNQTRNAVRSTVKEIEQQGLTTEQFFNNIKQTAAAIAAGFSAKSFINQMVQVRGEFQQLEVAFKTMLGNAEKADALMQQLTKTAAITPFDLQGVTNGAKQLLAYGIEAEKVLKLYEGRPNILDAMTNGDIDLIINTPSGKDSIHDDSYMRKNAIKYKIPYITTIAAARAAAEGIGYIKESGECEVLSLQEWHSRIKE